MNTWTRAVFEWLYSVGILNDAEKTSPKLRNWWEAKRNPLPTREWCFIEAIRDWNCKLLYFIEINNFNDSTLASSSSLVSCDCHDSSIDPSTSTANTRYISLNRVGISKWYIDGLKWRRRVADSFVVLRNPYMKCIPSVRPKTTCSIAIIARLCHTHTPSKNESIL